MATRQERPSREGRSLERPKVMSVETALASLVGWRREGDGICRRYAFATEEEVLLQALVSQSVGAGQGRLPRMEVLGLELTLYLPPEGEDLLTEDDLVVARILESNPEPGPPPFLF